MKKLALTTCVVVLLCAGMSAPGVSQTNTHKELLSGSWTLVSVQLRLRDGRIEKPYGPNGKGILILEGNGRFAFIVVNPDIPKAAYRDAPTPDEAMAIAKGSLSFFGRYLADESRPRITFSVEAGSSPNLNGTDQYYFIKNLTENELIIDLIPPPGGGPSMQFVYKRGSAAAPTR